MSEIDDTSAAIGALQARVDGLEETLRETKKALKEVSDKLDCLLAAANMGKGAWWAVIKFWGIVLSTLTGFGIVYHYFLGRG